jgi:ribose transport system ATP-binding protein
MVSEQAVADGAEPRPLLLLKSIRREYPGVVALDGVDFELRAGEVHVLFGENGAGKSTLISLIAGAHQPTAGEIFLNGQRVTIGSVHEARRLGIGAVFQEFSLVPQMTVEENLFLGAEAVRRGFLRRGEMHRGARELLERLGFPLRPGQRVDQLTRAEQQMVEIAKAFRSDLSILILDEPTASLTDREADQLFDLIAQAKARGVGVVYITHRMQEIRRIGDRITVLRDGRYVATVDARTSSETELLRLMTGRRISEIFPTVRHQPGETLLEVERLTTARGTVREASLGVRRGEIVGLAGLVGSGKSEVARACFGLVSVVDGGVRFKGEAVTNASTRSMLSRGLFYLPPDRRDEGLMTMRAARENMALPALCEPGFRSGPFLSLGGERARTRALAERLDLRPPRVERAVDHFSGGNQQKIMLAKCLTREVALFVFDEPTVGVDVGTRVAIYQFIRELCEAGAGVVLISSDLPEVLNLSHRLYVFYRGRVQAELAKAEISEERVLSHFFEREAA